MCWWTYPRSPANQYRVHVYAYIDIRVTLVLCLAADGAADVGLALEMEPMDVEEQPPADPDTDASQPLGLAHSQCPPLLTLVENTISELRGAANADLSANAGVQPHNTAVVQLNEYLRKGRYTASPEEYSRLGQLVTLYNSMDPKAQAHLHATAGESALVIGVSPLGLGNWSAVTATVNPLFVVCILVALCA